MAGARRLSRTGFLPRVLAAIIAAVPAVQSSAALLDCLPEIKYACDEEACGREVEGFQHAERFRVDTAIPWVEACLWTTCYAGRAVAFRSTDGEETTVVGNLPSLGDPKMYPPRVVSVTIEQSGRFVAIWGYGGRGLVFDQGLCRPVSEVPH